MKRKHFVLKFRVCPQPDGHTALIVTMAIFTRLFGIPFGDGLSRVYVSGVSAPVVSWEYTNCETALTAHKHLTSWCSERGVY